MNRVIQQSNQGIPGDVAPKPYDFEAILSIEMIREHTKTDDVPSVTDQLLVIYRLAALQAAQAYTGLLITERKFVTESVRIPKPKYSMYEESQQSDWFTHTTQHGISGGFVYFYGMKARTPEKIFVEPNTRKVRLSRYHNNFGIGCCNPCTESEGARLSYYAGFNCESDIPAAISLGAMKYIAHLIENTGAEAEKYGGTISGREASPALVSGAIEIWRSAMPDAI